MTKVAMESVDGVRRRLAVEIPAAEVTAQIERAYDQLRQRARVPGFRQGRAPRSVLERMFGAQVRADVFGRLVSESYADAVREQHGAEAAHMESAPASTPASTLDAAPASAPEAAPASAPAAASAAQS